MKKFAWIVSLCLAMGGQALAQEDAPQVLTTDLALRQVVESDRLTVNFVIVDDDDVVKVTIDGEPQQFEPGDTVLITKEFVFTPGRRIIKVVVEDQAGNVRERTFLVAFGVPLEAEEEKKEKPGLRIVVVAEIRLEIDDNPSQDLSIPFGVSIEGLGTIEGQIDDSEQEDTRTTLKGVVVLLGDGWSAFGGAVNTTYSKKQFAFIETRVLLAGGQIKFTEGDGFFINGLATSVAVGGQSFSTSLGASPGFEVNTKDADGTGKHLYILDLNQKSFDDPAAESAFEFALKWLVKSLDNEKQDAFKSLLAYGNQNSAGFKETEFNFLRWDADWENKWDSGFLWNLGFGYEYRDYPNDKDVLTTASPFGKTRLDNIIRYSTALGWEFGKLTVLFNYEFKANLSNDSPYERTVYGLVVKGTF